MDRVSFIEHQGSKVLLVDLTGCTPEEVLEISKEVVRVVTAQPRGSVLLMADFTGARVDRETVTFIKEGAVRDAPYIKKSAWVGVESFGDVWFKAVKTFSTRSLPAFKTRGEALDWLVKGENKAAAS